MKECYQNIKQNEGKYYISTCIFLTICAYRNVFFFIIKSKLRTIWNKGVIKLYLKSNIVEIWKWLKEVKSKYVRLLFKNMYSSINKYI